MIRRAYIYILLRLDVYYPSRFLWQLARSRGMKKQTKASTALVMWVMIILVHPHLSFAAQENGANYSVCCGSVQDCLIANDLDSELPDAVSSHFRRVLAQSQATATQNTLILGPAITGTKNGYCGSSVLNQNKLGGRNDCRNMYKKVC